MGNRVVRAEIPRGATTTAGCHTGHGPSPAVIPGSCPFSPLLPARSAYFVIYTHPPYFLSRHHSVSENSLLSPPPTKTLASDLSFLIFFLLFEDPTKKEKESAMAPIVSKDLAICVAAAAAASLAFVASAAEAPAPSPTSAAGSLSAPLAAAFLASAAALILSFLRH
uniref:Uncharacterized protein n=1 Tax=Ananas comosus var. bracteatus TaxID=296719 RepID=A0A6V7QTJ5_ANACO